MHRSEPWPKARTGEYRVVVPQAEEAVTLELRSVHFLSRGLLRGLLRADVNNAQEALDALRDPRRLWAFDMTMPQRF